LLCRWAPVEAWHPHMSTNDRTDAYGVTTEERFRLLLEEWVELKRQEIEQMRRLADAAEQRNDHMEARGEVDVR